MTRKEMTSREKIGQLFMVGFMGTTVTAELASFIKEYKPGGVILFSRNLESVEQIVELTNDLQPNLATALQRQWRYDCSPSKQ